MTTPPPEFDVEVDATSPGVTVVHVLGELDMATCPRVEQALASVSSATRVVIDLSGCTFLDSSGVRLLVTAHRDGTAEGRDVELVASDPNLRRVLEITNVHTMMTVHSTIDAAL